MCPVASRGLVPLPQRMPYRLIVRRRGSTRLVNTVRCFAYDSASQLPSSRMGLARRADRRLVERTAVLHRRVAGPSQVPFGGCWTRGTRHGLRFPPPRRLSQPHVVARRPMGETLRGTSGSDQLAP